MAPVAGYPVGTAPGGQAPAVAHRGGARAGWALALGIGAFVFAWVPFLGIVLAAVGLLLAVLELVSGTRGARVVWATVLSTVALLTGIAVTSVIALAGDGSGAAAPAAVESGPAETQDGKASPGPAAADEPEAEPKSADEPKAAGLGDPVRDGKLEFTVTKIETGVAEIGDEYFGKKAQGQFLLVHVKVENIGDEAQTFFGENVTALDADRREFSADTEAAIYLDESNSFVNEINPGNTAEGIVVFDVSKDTKITALELHDSFFSDGVTVKVS
jgi:ribosomal protein L12E/L44/L45/RPP1/RPP2